MDALEKLKKTAATTVQEAAKIEPQKKEEAEKTKVEAPPSSPAQLTEEEFLKIAKEKGFAKQEYQETEEQKLAREKQEREEVVTYAISQMKMNPEDLARPILLKEVKDEDLVYEDFKAKELRANPKLKEEKIRKNFMKLNPLAEYPEFTGEETDVDYEEALEKYNKDKEEYNADREEAILRVKDRATYLRNKMNQPFEIAKQNYANYKNGEKLYLKVSEEVNKFAKDFGTSFVYESENGNINIDFPQEFTRDEFIKTLTDRVAQKQFSNPSGSVDLKEVAEEILYTKLRKNIDGILRSKYLNEGIAEGKRAFKNPLTSPINTSGDFNTEDAQKAAKTNNASMNNLKKLVTH